MPLYRVVVRKTIEVRGWIDVQAPNIDRAREHVQGHGVQPAWVTPDRWDIESDPGRMHIVEVVDAP